MAMPQVGQKAARSLKLTPEHVATYAEITGDRNPLHFDEGFAARTKFGRLVVQGGIEVDDQRQQDPNAMIALSSGRHYRLRIGRRKFALVTFKG